MMNEAYLSRGTVIDALRSRARETPERRLYTFVGGDGRDRDSLNGRELLEAAVGLAAHLRGERGFKPGERILLCYPPSLDFVKALFGCMLGGIIPVPVAPPNPMRGGYEVQALGAIAANSGARGILTNGEYQRARKLAGIQRLLRKDEKWPKLTWHRTDNVVWGQDVPIAEQRPAMNDLALLQYTSGSTAAPKGVMITHGNIAHQIWLNWHELGIDDQSQGVSWVPHFHDMGLINTILNAVISNGHLYMLSPLSFLRRPAVWFEVMSRVGATHTAAPAFAYSLAVRKTTAAERRGWDLSSLKVVMSAAEPIRPSAVDPFFEAFASCGLNPGAFCPAYGLAEHSVGVTVFGHARVRVSRAALERERKIAISQNGGKDTLTIIGCGVPSQGVDVRIIDPESLRECRPGEIGEVWVDSPSKAAGYFGLPELSQEVFQARLEGSVAGRYLRTGDLGFFEGGELFITGRIKDMINSSGRNIYPQDLEEGLADCHVLVRPGRVVAFSIPTGRNAGESPGETVVVMLEVNRDKLSEEEIQEVILSARRQLLRNHMVAAQVVIVVPKGSVMKTTSGKLRRGAHRDAFLNGALDGTALAIDWAEIVGEEISLGVERPRRVAVIGGGVSGLTAAYELERLGHRVTLFEREPQVGGKVTAVQVGDQLYDLGGLLVSDHYYGLRQVAGEIGARFEIIGNVEAVDEAGHLIQTTDLSLSDPVFRQQYGQIREEEFPNISSAGIMHDSERLATWTGAWLAQKGLEMLAELGAGLMYAAFGNGHLESTSIPVAYFLKFLETIGRPAEGDFGQSSLAVGSMARLLERLAGQLNDVRCNADVSQIIRTNQGVQVTCRGESINFDDIILASPFENAPTFLDASDEEAHLFSRIRTLDYFSTLCSVEGLRPGRSFLVKQRCLDPATAGHLVYAGSQRRDSDVFLLCAYGASTLSEDDVITYLEEDLAQMGAKLSAVHAKRRWRYMPHVSGEDIEEGYFRRFESLQGKNRTYYAGSLLAMETIESNLAYAYELVRRYFKPAHYDVDSRRPYLHLSRSQRSPLTFDSVAIKDWLVERLAAEFGISREMVDPAIPITAFNLDSLKAMGLLAQLESELAINAPQDLLLRGLTIEELSVELESVMDGQVAEPAGITPILPIAAADDEWEEGAL